MTFTWWRLSSSTSKAASVAGHPPSISQPRNPDQLAEKLRLLSVPREEPTSYYPLSQPCDPDQLTKKLRLLAAEKGSHNHHLTSSSPTTTTTTTKKRREAKQQQQQQQQHKVKLHRMSAPVQPRDAAEEDSVRRSQSHTYRHIPQEAASQFVRTTTVHPDNRLSYRLSRQASISRPDALLAFQHGNASQCELGHTSFLLTDPLSSCPCPDHHPLDSRPRSMIQLSEPQSLNRRRSTGGILAKPGYLHNAQPFDPSSSLAPVEEHQTNHHQPVDWTQSDESCIQSTTSAVSSYLVHKQELTLLLRRRLRAFAARSKDREPTLEPIQERTSSSTPRSGIFARFRR
ncbi:hypothetical protein CP532_1667 [Ophiocordyceps camponoti-leonardi (nom. inval.)]|nr:hypothetical protein CP532_1667 [Ophiocordyceps camponoti-leonardi (nom. inval.)]